MGSLISIAKYLSSFLKSDWTLSDYPLRTFRLPPREPSEDSHRRRGFAYTWGAEIINWRLMTGFGLTRDEALQNIERQFTSFKEHNQLPRPGTRVPATWQWAPHDGILRNRVAVRDFVEHILLLDPNKTWLTDESNVWYFHNGETNEAIFEKIRLRYGVDVSDIDPPLIVSICRRIDEQRGS